MKISLKERKLKSGKVSLYKEYYKGLELNLLSDLVADYEERTYPIAKPNLENLLNSKNL